MPPEVRSKTVGQLSSETKVLTPIQTPTNTPNSDRQPIKIVPKGLRSFDANDADFFLELLPGPRDRDGLPASIRFWKIAIEETDSDKTFSVGLLYGPSGCGKSSLVKAGLLPHLSGKVIAVFIEATAEQTELRLLNALRKSCPNLSANLSLQESMQSLRRAQNRKVVIIIDQFEQWLHSHRVDSDAELVKALMQCDGSHLQAIIMVRDDFAMAAARFMNAIDIPIIQGENFETVDLFDIKHATKVLTRFGQAFGRLPEGTSDLSTDEKSFIHEVVEGLAEEGKVVSVRLSLFAEMIKNKPWTLETLRKIGGTKGIGVSFLQEIFDSKQSNPRHRLHIVAARGVLQALMPELGTDIKGHMRSHVDLLEASGYQNRPAEFADLLRILDSELRLITPTDAEGIESQEPVTSGSPRPGTPGRGVGGEGPALLGSSPPQPNLIPTDYGGDRENVSFSTTLRFFQLTHDYLVPSLRDWLTRKQRETRAGRAELKLTERSSQWNAKPENRYLPSVFEWLSIQRLTAPKRWTVAQRTMMTKANRVYFMRSVITAAMTCLLIATGFGILKQTERQRNQVEATRLVEGLLKADTAQVSTSISDLKAFRTWSVPQLKQAFAVSDEDSNAKLHAALALLSEGKTADSDVIPFLRERLLVVTPIQLGPVRSLLASHKSDLVPAYWQTAMNEQEPAPRRFHAAVALAGFEPEHTNWNNATFTKFVVGQLVAVNPVYAGQYQELFRPVAQKLLPELSSIFKDSAQSELSRSLATSFLEDDAAKDPKALTDLILAADAKSDKVLFPVLLKHRQAAIQNLDAVLDRRLDHDWHDKPLDPSWTAPTASQRAQIEAAHGLIADRFAFCQDMPLEDF